MGTGETSEKDPTDGTFKNLMDLKECIQDSPNFRQQLRSREREISDLEGKLEKVVTMCDKMVYTGNAYTETCRSFSVSLKELASHFPGGEVVAVTLKKFFEALCELQSFYSVLFDQTQKNVQACLRNYLSSELRKVRETKKSFDRVSEELAYAINRNGHAPKSKPVEADEASSHLMTMQTQFSHSAVDYSYQINLITCNKSHEIIQSLLAYMRAQTTFFHEGYDLLRQFDPFMKEVEGKVDILIKSAQAVVQEMELRHTYVSPKNLEDSSHDEPYSPMENPSLPIEMSGYLFKKPRGSNPFKSWSRRWFILKTSKLVYQSESKEEEHVTVASDLRICTVKLAEDQERRFCFEVVTPTRSCMLQADSEMLRRKWLAYLEAGIARALNISASNKKSEDSEDFRKRSMVVTKGTPVNLLNESPTGQKNDMMNSNYSLGIDFLDVPGNNICADCSSAKPTWASINLGIMLCIECSGIHRGMGVHISKVRSVTLDDWEPELQKIMCALGNARVNAIYEYEIPQHIKKPTTESSRSVREAYIRLKYVQHAFVHPHPNFQRPEAPVPPISIPELLAPSSKGIGSSPRSPQKRSFSPSLKLRPRLLKQVPRPSSASSTLTDQSTPTGSEEDLRKVEYTQPSETATGLYALAENFKKIEEKKKGIGGLSRSSVWGATLGDKLKSARRSSKKISNFAMNKLGEGQESLMKRLKKTGRDRASREFLRETLSDTEEEVTNKNNSSLLFSLSASTHNLSTKSGSSRSSGKHGKGVNPPPKPPRTFKLKSMQDLNRDEGNDTDEETDDVPFELDNGKFSSDILAAIQTVGSYPSSVDGDVGLSNGRIPSTSSSSSVSSSLPETKHMMRSESSPQLSHTSLLIHSESSNSNINQLSESPRLQTISEDSTDNPQPEQEHKSIRTSLNISPLPHASPVISPDTRLTNSVPLRRRQKLNGNIPSADSKDDSSIFLSSAHSGSDVFISSPLDVSLPSLPKLESTPEPRCNSSTDNRISMVSVTSAEYFSAESSDGSKPNSVSPSPDLISGKGSLMSISPIPLVGGMVCSSQEGLSGQRSHSISERASKQKELTCSHSCNNGHDNLEGMRENRVNSSQSVDDDSFNTPPSSPCPSVTPSSNMSHESASLAVYDALDYPAGAMATLKAGLLLSPGGGTGDHMTNSSTSSSTLKGLEVNPSSGNSSSGSGLQQIKSSSTLKGEDNVDANLRVDVQVSGSAGADVAARVNDDDGEGHVSSHNGSALKQTMEQNGAVVINVVERSEQRSRNDDSDSVFSESPVTPTTVTSSPAPVPPKRVKRRRSSTMSNTSADTLPIRGSKAKWKHKDQLDANVTKDDNFGLEYKSTSKSSLVSSFSEKDYEDIFSSLKTNIGTVTEDDEESRRKTVTELEPSPEVEVEIEGEEPLKLEEVLPNGDRGDELSRESMERDSEITEDLKNWTIVIPDTVHPNSYLYSSVTRTDIPGILCALAHGASPNYTNEEEESRTPVLAAIQMGNKVIVEYLYQNGSKLVMTDKFGKGCLHYAAMLDDASLVMVLLKRGADPALQDSEGHEPIHYALELEQQNADIITMLRMATFREETKSGDNKQSEYLEEQESEFFRDVEVASLVHSGRTTSNRLSTPSIEESSSLDSK